MTSDLILGTAGHIDHGKTSLVRALTGIDCDRLPEEKSRGITIDIGFAYLDLGEYRLGIVDVPGHERFIKNMLAGATGVDIALLAVAADDSVMPQTREHLEILKLLGVRHGLIALTKTDLVDATTRDVVTLEIRDLVKDSFLASASIVPVSATTVAGLDLLKRELEAVCKAMERRSISEWFRLPIDRAFVVQGHGTVVTGSVASGVAHIGDELDWHKGDGTVETIRVRSLTNHGVAVAEVHRGQRAGVNLAGIPHDAVRRGQELCSPGFLVASKILTVRLFASPELRRPIKHRLPVRFHIGTAEVIATLSLLDCDHIESGKWGLAQLFVEEPVTAVWGQAFIIRDSSAEHTLGGGQVLQPVADKIRRRHLETLVRVDQLWSEIDEIRLLTVAWFSQYEGVSLIDLIRGAGVGRVEVSELVAKLLANGSVVEILVPSNRKLLIHGERLSDLEHRVLDVLAKLHAENPLLTSHDRPKTIALLDYVGDDSLLQVVTDRLIREKKLIGDSRRIARSDFKPRLSANQRKLKDRIVESHVASGFQPPDPTEFANLAGGNAVSMNDIYDVAIAEGLLVKVCEGIYLSAEAEEEMKRRVTNRLQSSSGATVAEIRDLLGTTRKYAVPFCEYLDRIGFTKRTGDLRILSTPS